MAKPKAEEEDFSAILRNAKSAVDFLVQHKIPPAPERFKVAYLHFAGTAHEMSLGLSRLVSQNKVTPQAIDEIHDQFFGDDVSDKILRDASRRIEKTVADVTDVIDAAAGSAEHYGEVLADFSGKAGEGGSDLTNAVSGVLGETKRMSEINRSLEAKLQESSKEIETLRQSLEQAEREASIDGLTGIANRKRFDSTMRQVIEEAERSNLPLSLLMVDIDHFKKFNDTFGHQMGDQVLRLVARYMSDCIKGNDLAARYGGEEFGVVLPRTKLEDAIRVGTQICAYVASKKVVNRKTGQDLGQITLSLGAAMFRPGDSGAELVHRADEALYFAKRAGRNRVASEKDVAAPAKAES